MSTSHSDSTTFNLARLGTVVLLAFLVAAIARADNGNAGKDRLPSVAVKYGDLDISTDAGARALYARLGIAAKRVCPDAGSRDLRTFQLVQACRHQAVDRAVRNLDSAALASVHSQHVTTG